MSGGGKGGSEKQSVQIPAWLEQSGKRMLTRGEQLSQTAMPVYRGLTQAAPSDMTKQFITNSNAGASALGLGMSGDPLAGLPQEVELDGMRGYRASDVYDAEAARQWEQNPDQMHKLNSLMPGLFDVPEGTQQQQQPTTPQEWQDYIQNGGSWNNIQFPWGTGRLPF